MIHDGFSNFLARLGLGRTGNQTLSAGRYDVSGTTRDRARLEAMYRSSWIVGKVVDAIAEDMTRAGVEMTGSVDPARIAKLNRRLSSLGCWAAINDALKWSRLYGGSIAVIEIAGQDPTTPLDPTTVALDQCTGLSVYDRHQLSPSLQDLVQTGRDRGLPTYYTILPAALGAITQRVVHHSRVLRFVGVALPMQQAVTESLWGQSVVERLEDRVQMFDSATHSAAGLVFKAHLRTIQIDGFREILAAGGEAEANLIRMFEMIRVLQNSEAITLLDKTDTFATSSYTFAGLSDMLIQFGQQISGACGIPLVRLFGQSPAGLNATGESDLRTYYDTIATAQETSLRDGLELLLQVVWRSTFGSAPPDDFDFNFSPLWQQSQSEKAATFGAVSTAVIALLDAGVLDVTAAQKEIKALSDTTGIGLSVVVSEPAPLIDPTAPIDGI